MLDVKTLEVAAKRLYAALTSKKKTLLGYERFFNAGKSVFDCAQAKIAGNIVECGTYRCGALAFMAFVANQQ
jgi:hypothetical protein